MVLSEKDYIEDLLENGLSPSPNPYEIQLLATFYHYMGIELKEKIKKMEEQGEDASALRKEYNKYRTKKNVKDIIKEKCEKYYTVSYTSYFTMLNTNIEKGWARKIPLKEVPNLKISKSTIQWFLSQNLDDSCKKVLFALYVQIKIRDFTPSSAAPSNIQNWSRGKSWSRFKKYAALPDSVGAEKTIETLRKKKYIETNMFSTSFKVIFVDRADTAPSVLDKDGDCDEIVEMSHYDMQHPSEFFQQFLYGSFVCERCGRTVGYKSASKKSQVKQKYCSECAEIMHRELSNKKYIRKKV